MIKIKDKMKEIPKYDYIFGRKCFYVVSKTYGIAWVYRYVHICNESYIYCVYCQDGASFYTEFSQNELFNDRFDEAEYDIYECSISKIHTDVEIEV